MKEELDLNKFSKVGVQDTTSEDIQNMIEAEVAETKKYQMLATVLNSKAKCEELLELYYLDEGGEDIEDAKEREKTKWGRVLAELDVEDTSATRAKYRKRKQRCLESIRRELEANM